MKSRWRRQIKNILIALWYVTLGGVGFWLELEVCLFVWQWTWSEEDPKAKQKRMFLRSCQKDVQCLRRWFSRHPLPASLKRDTKRPQLLREVKGRKWGLALMAAVARKDRGFREAMYGFDAIAVCGVPASPKGEVTWLQRARIKRGKRLYDGGLAPWLITSGGAVHNAFVEAHVMAKEAKRQGIPQEAIIPEPWARHTTGNVRYSVIIGLKRHWRRLFMVSDWWHTIYISAFTGGGAYGGKARSTYFRRVRGVSVEIERCPRGGDRSPAGKHEAQQGAPQCPVHSKR